MTTRLRYSTGIPSEKSILGKRYGLTQMVENQFTRDTASWVKPERDNIPTSINIGHPSIPCRLASRNIPAAPEKERIAIAEKYKNTGLFLA
jgi:hypothetical protein